MKLFTVLGLGVMAALALSSCTPVGIVIGGAAMAGVTIVEERSVKDAVNDANLKINILNALFEEDEDLFVDVSTTVIEGRVMVTGEVPSDKDRETATTVIWSIDGVKTVLNELQVSHSETLSSTAGDAWITAKLKAGLIQDLDIKHVNYSIDTVNDVVYLMGIAQDQAEIERVYLHAKEISGVRKIISHVVLKDNR